MKKVKAKKTIEKICLIDPTSIHDKWRFSTHSIREPLGIECIGAVLKEKGFEVKILQQGKLSDEELLQKVIEFNPQVVGFTSYSYNFNHACELAKKLKEKKLDILTIFGGYHVTFCFDEVKNDFIDFVVRGEGELTMLELIDALNRNEPLENVKGIVYFNGNKIIITPQRERIKNLDALPFALRNETILKNLKIDGLMYPPPSRQKNPALIFASRGCPYNCYYCASPNFYGTYVSYRSIKNVVREIKFLKEQFGTNVLYFTDLTFNLNKNYVKELCKQIIQENLGIFWYALCRPDNLDGDTVKLMKEAGCTKIGFGIDSVSEDILKYLNRRVSIQKLAETFQMVSSYGIIVRGTLIFGFPWDTKNIYEYTLKILNTLSIDEIRVAIFSPYPGTLFFEKHRDSILNFNYELYNSQTPLIRMKYIKPEEVMWFADHVVREFYNSPQYKERIKQKIRKYPELAESYNEFKKDLQTNLYSNTRV